MQIEEVRKIAEEEMNKSIMKNLDSAIIFKYISNLENELEKKDAIINEMAKMINSHDIDEDVCAQMGKKKDCNDYIMFEENCIDCIKEYFYKKAR